MNKRLTAAIALTASLGLLAAACGDDDGGDAGSDTTAATEETTTTAAGGEETTTTAAAGEETTTTAGGEPGGPCPANIVIQTDWWPELEHGGNYQLIGPNGTADAETFRYSGPIQPQYAEGTGVETVEIRAGGDAIAFTPVTSEMYQKDEITFGYVNTDDAAKDSATAPVIGVMKTLEINPQILYWDPAQTTIEKPEDMAASGKPVLHFDGTTYMDYLVAQGYVTADQLDPSYGGAPDRWIETGGNIIQQGFATNEVYKYENVFEWKDGAPAPIDYLLIHDLGYETYPAMLSVRKDKLEELAPCLEVLIPKMQQAWVDYWADPTPVTDALVEINNTYDTYWKVDAALNAAGIAIADELGISANGPAGDYGSLTPERVQGLLDILTAPGGVFEKRGIEVADDLSVDTLITNEFIDPSIGR
jgi:hypothetical protein